MSVEAEQLLGEIDDPIVHDDVVERAVLERKARHDAVRIDPERLVACRIHVVRELLRRRDQGGQHRLGGGDGLGRQQPMNQAPPVLFPLRLLGAAEHARHAATVMGRRVVLGAFVTMGEAPPSGSAMGRKLAISMPDGRSSHQVMQAGRGRRLSTAHASVRPPVIGRRGRTQGPGSCRGAVSAARDQPWSGTDGQAGAPQGRDSVLPKLPCGHHCRGQVPIGHVPPGAPDLQAPSAHQARRGFRRGRAGRRRVVRRDLPRPRPHLRAADGAGIGRARSRRGVPTPRPSRPSTATSARPLTR